MSIVTSSYSGLPNKLARAANGVEYAYRDTGGGEGAVPLVLLQHCRGNLDNWDPALIDALASDRRVITFDNAGVGGSTGTTPSTVEQMAHDAIAFIAAMELGQVDLRPARLILLGEDASPRLRRSTSLDSLVTPQSPPFFIWHTAEDAYVPPEHTYRFASVLAAGGVPHAVHVFAHGPHGLGLARDAGETATWTTLTTAWIGEQAASPG